jgi:hypothetical protein
MLYSVLAATTSGSEGTGIPGSTLLATVIGASTRKVKVPVLMYMRSTEGSFGSKGSTAPEASAIRPSTRFAVPGERTSIEPEANVANDTPEGPLSGGGPASLPGSKVGMAGTWLVETQVPPRQDSPPRQALEQDPQWAGSEEVLVQIPEHSIVPLGQEHPINPVHDWPAGQAFPQDPQWAGSEEVSTQTPEHSCVPEGQEHPINPVHDWPAGHALKQEPQWAGLEEVSTQTPEHSRRPGGQLSNYACTERSARPATITAPKVPLTARMNPLLFPVCRNAFTSESNC